MDRAPARSGTQCAYIDELWVSSGETAGKGDQYGVSKAPGRPASKACWEERAWEEFGRRAARFTINCRRPGVRNVSNPAIAT